MKPSKNNQILFKDGFCQFVSSFSHQARNSISLILSSTGILRLYREKMDNENIDKHLLSIESQILRLNNTLEDVSYLAKFQDGLLSNNPNPINPINFCRKQVEHVDSLVKAINCPVNLYWDDYNTWTEINLDTKHLTLIVTRLLSNCLICSPENTSVTFTLSCPKNHLHLIFQDQGIGIPSQEIGNIFQPFYRSSLSKEINGTGLGLTVVEKAVQLCGGTIEIESEGGQGTNCRVKLPFTRH